jgi:hypothetical protein
MLLLLWGEQEQQHKEHHLLGTKGKQAKVIRTPTAKAVGDFFY